MLKTPDEIKADRLIAANWAYELLKKPSNCCLIDTETTGFSYTDQICEVAAVDLSGAVLLNCPVKPTIAIPASTTDIHGWTDDKVQDALSFDQVFLLLLKAVGSRDVIFYGADFDIRLIRQSMRAHGIQVAFSTSDLRGCRIFTNGGSIHCLMMKYAAWNGVWSEDRRDYKWQKLPAAGHTALIDCLAAVDVIREMAGSLTVS